jgi:Family of unknown function (DUF6765)
MTTMAYRARIFFVALLLALSLSTQISAWDADVHYGLTLWLAIQAGFSPDDAKAIAEADEGLDNSPSTGPLWNGAYIAIRNDKRASLTMQMYHFPSYGPVPGSKADQKDRTVVINSPAARELVEFEITVKRQNSDKVGELVKFGAALHVLQDSWSHSGVPDIPFRCLGGPVGPDLSWGHPITRGGWYLHDADWTSLHEGDTKQMALETYKALLRYRAKYPAAPSNSPDFSSFSSRMDEFTAARTKGEKEAAFRTVGGPFTAPGGMGFIQRTTLSSNWEKVARTVPPCSAASKVIQIAARQTVPLPSAIFDFVQDFLTRWIVDRNIDGAIGLVSTPGINAQLGELVGPANGADTWIRRALTMWLIADHGLVNIKGHGMPGQPGYGDLPTSPADTSAALQPRARPPAAGLSQLILSPDGTPFTIAPLDGAAFGLPEAYAVLFRFVGLPADSVVLVVGREGASFRVVRLLWMVN